MGSSAKERSVDSVNEKEIRMPWFLKVTFAVGVLVPVCMIVHSSDRQLKDMKQELQLKESARLSAIEAMDMQSMIAAQSATEAKQLAGEVKAIAGSKYLVEQQLKRSSKWLDDERQISTGLQQEINKLASQRKAYQEREGELKDIIELLEGEVASVEGRLKKLKHEQDVLQVASTNVVDVRDQETVFGGTLPGNSKSKDAQMIALLNEVGVMNSEIEEVRQERDMLKNELDRITASYGDDGQSALRQSKRQGRPIFAGFRKDND